MPKITAFEIENVKRVKAVAVEPAASGLTVIGGKNGQGKTSVLDAIAWALGGDRFRPSNPQREGSVTPPHLKVTLDNGLIVERSGKNSSLKVTDPAGNKSGQQLLNGFIEQLALDLPRFMAASDKEKAETLLKIIGVGERLYQLDNDAARIYNERHAVGQIADRKAKSAQEMRSFSGVPSEPISAAELIQKQQDILARNARRQQWRQEQDGISAAIALTKTKIAEAEDRLKSLTAEMEALEKKAREAQKTPAQMEMESTAELETSIREIEDINRKVRENLDKARAEDEAKAYQEQYDKLTADLDAVRSARRKLLNGANLPLDGLSVDENMSLTYKGQPWDGMSGADQLRVACAIVRKLNPNCNFVLMDKLEQMDAETLKDFGAWLEAENLQVIATRVSTGDECSLIIEDGYVQTAEPAPGPKSEGGYWN